MSNMQQSLNADQTKGLTQARTEEYMEATKQIRRNEEKDEMLFPNDSSSQPQLCAPNYSNQHSHHQHKQQQSSTFLQQTGEKMAHMAQDAVETVKETLGMGEKK